MEVISNTFSFLAGMFSPVIAILTGLLFLKARDILSIVSHKDDHLTLSKIEGIAKISYLIGVLTIIYGAVRICLKIPYILYAFS